jgi:deoxyribonuclease-4
LEKGGITSYVNNDTVHAVCLIHCSIFIKTLVALASIFSSKIRIYFPLSQQTRETKTIKINSLEIITLDLSAVGRHISVSEIKKNEIFSKPFQFFCMNPQSYNSSCFDESEIEKVKTKIKNFGFVHAPYIFNLAKKSSIEGSKKCLELSSKLNAKGVVFHCGKGDDILTFEYVVKELCKNSNQECPCILETPAGQGTEMLYKFSEFVSFCKKIENLKVCIDTCHVFASGYDPYEYILKSLTYLRDKIVLVHFNDSQYHCGSRLDRHAYPGHGYIGMETMLKVYELCLMYSIPMVIE